jgi:hypothetical protein
VPLGISSKTLNVTIFAISFENNKVLPLSISFVAGGNRFALTCINPSFIVGPLLVDEQGASVTV